MACLLIFVFPRLYIFTIYFLEKGSQKQDSKDQELSSDEDDDEHLAQLVKNTFKFDEKNCSGSTSSVGSSWSGNVSPK